MESIQRAKNMFFCGLVVCLLLGLVFFFSENITL